MNPHLDRLQQSIASAINGLTPEDLARHPDGKWCTAEILEHLFLTYTGTIKGLERCLREGKPLATVPSFRDRLGTFFVIGLGYLPEGRKAPDRTTPKGTPNVAAQIVPAIQNMNRLFADCGSRFDSHTLLMDHPILGPLTGNQWCKFHWVHGRHHLRQISRLRSSFVAG